MPCRWKQSRISCACRYSNAAIAQPVRQVLLTPAPVIGRRVEGPERRVVHNRFMGVNERVAKAHFQRSPRRRFELRQPLGRDRRLLNGAALHSALFQLVSVHGRLLHYFSDPSQPKPVPNPKSFLSTTRRVGIVGDGGTASSPSCEAAFLRRLEQRRGRECAGCSREDRVTLLEPCKGVAWACCGMNC